MEDIVLTKETINKLFIVYDQFKLFDDYTVILSSDGTVSVKFNIDKLQKNSKKFIEETFR
jgi:hypothetical protein